MELRIKPDGNVLAVYSDDIKDLCLGDMKLSRASHVEPEGEMWMADLSPVGGPILGPFRYRGEALEAEVAWLHQNLIAQDY